MSVRQIELVSVVLLFVVTATAWWLLRSAAGRPR